MILGVVSMDGCGRIYHQVGYGLYLPLQFALQSNPQGIDLILEDENNSYLLQRI